VKQKPGTLPKLGRPARRAVLVVHVTASASWLGLTLGLLALGTTAATTGSAVTVEASVRALKLFARPAPRGELRGHRRGGGRASAGRR
jgi:hypothetical protein